MTCGLHILDFVSLMSTNSLVIFLEIFLKECLFKHIWALRKQVQAVL